MNYNKLYSDCIKTPPLWFDDTICEIKQFELKSHSFSFDKTITQNLRLGKLVERFITFQLAQNDAIKILVENYQVQNDKLTIGELDCLFLENKKPIHLEIVYKFYLYDTSVGNSELEYWIGPNRKDSLIQKLDKLKNKQLPLLYNQYTNPLLDTLDIEVESIEQKVCFKAQLFVPYDNETNDYKLVNKDCIKGFYLKKNQLNSFENCKFYIPKKLDWLLEVLINVAWKEYPEFLNQVTEILDHKTAPMCWIKHPNGELQKCFVVWW